MSLLFASALTAKLEQVDAEVTDARANRTFKQQRSGHYNEFERLKAWRAQQVSVFEYIFHDRL
jgi:hypothetical protein